ncbi:hypothetical protein LINPERPRIM_LOCUS12911, partial [Linum perenne]
LVLTPALTFCFTLTGTLTTSSYSSELTLSFSVSEHSIGTPSSSLASIGLLSELSWPGDPSTCNEVLGTLPGPPPAPCTMVFTVGAPVPPTGDADALPG